MPAKCKARQQTSSTRLVDFFLTWLTACSTLSLRIARNRGTCLTAAVRSPSVLGLLSSTGELSGALRALRRNLRANLSAERAKSLTMRCFESWRERRRYPSRLHTAAASALAASNFSFSAAAWHHFCQTRSRRQRRWNTANTWFSTASLRTCAHQKQQAPPFTTPFSPPAHPPSLLSLPHSEVRPLALTRPHSPSLALTRLRSPHIQQAVRTSALDCHFCAHACRHTPGQSESIAFRSHCRLPPLKSSKTYQRAALLSCRRLHKRHNARHVDAQP